MDKRLTAKQISHLNTDHPQYKQSTINSWRLVIGMLFACFFSANTFAITANPDSVSTPANTSISILVLNNDILDNGSSAGASSDTAVCLDQQSSQDSPCSAYELPSSPTSPENGTLSLVGKKVIYTPNEGFIGTDRFVYGAFYLEPEGSPQSDDANVTIRVNPPTEPTQEEQELEDAITSLCDNTSDESLSSSCSALENLPGNEKAAALRTLSADQVTAGFTSTVSMTRDQNANIASRITQLRHDSGGINLRGLTIKHHGEKLNGEWLHALYASMSNNGVTDDAITGGGAGNEANTKVYSPFGLFVNGSITLGDKDSTSTERGYELDSDNYTVGADYRISNSLVVGTAYGYSSSRIEFDSTGDDMDNKIHNLYLYGSMFADNFYFSTTIGYAFGEIDTARRIFIPNTVAKGNTDTEQFILQFSGNYDFTQGALSFGPYAKLDMIEGEIDSYTEVNGGGFEVAFASQDISSQILTVGGQAQYALSYSWGVLLPNTRFEIKNEFNDTREAINGRFALDPTNTNFSINSDEIDSLWFVAGAGLSAVFPHGLSAYVDVETVQGMDNLSLYTYSYGGRWEIAF